MLLLDCYSLSVHTFATYFQCVFQLCRCSFSFSTDKLIASKHPRKGQRPQCQIFSSGLADRFHITVQLRVKHSVVSIMSQTMSAESDDKSKITSAVNMWVLSARKRENEVRGKSDPYTEWDAHNLSASNRTLLIVILLLMGISRLCTSHFSFMS